ncbi:MAG: hypothetical protein K2H16_08070 [Prevotella sp.]|nr:hypothetical protein [Prevotella sp.]
MKRMAVVALLLCLVQNLAAGEKWVVTDSELTVWDSPNYQKQLGMVTRGYEIDAIAIEGDMIRFEYEGNTAYVATYCCKRVVDTPAVASLDAQEAETAVAPVEKAPVKAVPAENGVKVEQAGGDAKAGKTDAFDTGKLHSKMGWAAIPLMLFGVVFLIVGLAAMVFTVCYAFKPKALASWFNDRCDADVIPAKRFNKLLLPPVYAAIGMMVASCVMSGVTVAVGSGFIEDTPDHPGGMWILMACLGILANLAVVFSVPFFILRHWYKKYRDLYGKKAARWMTVYSIMGLMAIYLICVVMAYAVFGLVALLLLLLILCVCFPTRYYIVR